MEVIQQELGRRGVIDTGVRSINSLGELLKKKDFLKEFAKHPRFKYLDVIYKRVNVDRVQAGYRALPMKVYAIKTSHLSLSDLDYLVKQMQQSTKPGKVFFGALKTKRDED